VAEAGGATIQHRGWGGNSIGLALTAPTSMALARRVEEPSIASQADMARRLAIEYRIFSGAGCK
jgi:hypothetical protein